VRRVSQEGGIFVFAIFVTSILESVLTPARIRPYPAGRAFWVALTQALRARLRSDCPSGTGGKFPFSGQEIVSTFLNLARSSRAIGRSKILLIFAPIQPWDYKRGSRSPRQRAVLTDEQIRLTIVIRSRQWKPEGHTADDPKTGKSFKAMTAEKQREAAKKNIKKAAAAAKSKKTISHLPACSKGALKVTLLDRGGLASVES
jgi:hypothetical protein